MVYSLLIYLQLFTAFWPRQSDTLKLLFLGDIMQHDAQLESAYIGQGSRLEPGNYDYSAYFKYLKPWFSKADIVAANMETIFAPGPYSGYPVFCSPSSLAKETFESGINLFFAANNHSVDKGSRGLEGSMAIFSQLNIPYTGIYKDSASARKNHPYVIEKKGFRIALLNYTYGTNGINVPNPYVVNILDSNTVKKDMEAASLSSPHCIVVSVHWGEEYQLTPSAHQKKWEDFFYKHGAHLVIGSHPHVPQKVTNYKDSLGTINRITAYSLGNAISNMSARNTRIGIMLGIEIVKEHHTSRIHFTKPRIDYIWTSRPAATGGVYTIIPMEDYLDNPGKYPVKGEKALIGKYYNKFIKEHQ